MEPLNKGHFGAYGFREAVPISEVHQSISMGSKQVFFVERSSLSQRVPYRWFYCISFGSFCIGIMYRKKEGQNSGTLQKNSPQCTHFEVPHVQYPNILVHYNLCAWSPNVSIIHCTNTAHIQWNLRTRNTLGIMVLSLVERLSLSQS